MISNDSIGLLLVGLRVLAVLALYAFLIGALFTLWRDLVKHQANTLRSPIAEVKLTFADRAPFGEHVFQQPKITLGRSPSCDCMLDNSTVSTEHARLSYHHSQWWVEDLGSRNGTFLNQTRIEVPTVIIAGDEIRCGEVEFTFRVEQ
ncbi:MAG: FHA domain-containing protein [Anaerolineales bacterium]|nr:FHA domain-containing protein [Anaerolineales bacterium]